MLARTTVGLQATVDLVCNMSASSSSAGDVLQLAGSARESPWHLLDGPEPKRSKKTNDSGVAQPLGLTKDICQASFTGPLLLAIADGLTAASQNLGGPLV